MRPLAALAHIDIYHGSALYPLHTARQGRGSAAHTCENGLTAILAAGEHTNLYHVLDVRAYPYEFIYTVEIRELVWSSVRVLLF